MKYRYHKPIHKLSEYVRTVSVYDKHPDSESSGPSVDYIRKVRFATQGKQLYYILQTTRSGLLGKKQQTANIILVS